MSQDISHNKYADQHIYKSLVGNVENLCVSNHIIRILVFPTSKVYQKSLPDYLPPLILRGRSTNSLVFIGRSYPNVLLSIKIEIIIEKKVNLR